MSASAAKGRVEQLGAHLTGGPLLKGEVAIITGAGRGIGKTTALTFAAHGASIVVFDIDASVAEGVVGEIRANGGSAEAFAGRDITSAAVPDELVAFAISKYGKINHIINGAGFTIQAPLKDLSDSAWESVMAVHSTAPFRLTRAALPHMLDKKYAGENRSITNISSMAGIQGLAYGANYSAGKAALIGLTKSSARELGRHGIRVNAVAYGFVQTRLIGDSDKDGETHRLPDGSIIPVGVPTERAFAKALLHGNVLKRPGTTQEAAGPLLFLASPLASYITGQVLQISGDI
ncbi:short-chain dehydrogenase reductase sdr [Ceraceosorus bombacis]|uniref:Short-chain dehydrogenase reductase sdr n=1 Tax=Ceraceosorus bombacis TaxID=401625 RepID=A0A0P1BI26_9BASI|nr:short-chain dehydrogenase reductase sdr [Ceraceosorus bombacis]